MPTTMQMLSRRGKAIQRTESPGYQIAERREKAKAVFRQPFTLSDLKIQTKDSDFIKFTPNSVQSQYLDELCPNWRHDDYRMTRKREIILKARQFGFSTLILALIFLDTINRPNVNSVVIADSLENSEGLFQIVTRFYESLPADRRTRKRYGTKKELEFGDLNSRFRILTAGQKQAGRSKTIHNLLCSEVAFWTNDEVFTGLLQSVPSTGNIFIETTANGEGNAFHVFYCAAVEGLSEYVARFFAWFRHDEYKAEPPIGFTKDKDESALAKKYSLSDWQVYWRRLKQSEPGQLLKFPQEYPATWKEAFLVSGSKFFPEWVESLHVIDPFPINPDAGEWFGGLDWGKAVPFSFGLYWQDSDGNVFAVDEEHEALLTNQEQALRVLRCLERNDVPKGERGNYLCRIAADPMMFPPKDAAKRIGEFKIDEFKKAGLRVIPAINDRENGWLRVKEYIATGRFRAFSGRCGALIRELTIAKSRDKHPEDMDDDCDSSHGHMDAANRHRYAMMTRAKLQGVATSASVSHGTLSTALGEDETTGEDKEPEPVIAGQSPEERFGDIAPAIPRDNKARSPFGSRAGYGSNRRGY